MSKYNWKFISVWLLLFIFWFLVIGAIVMIV